MPDGSIVTSTSTERTCPLDIETKAYRLKALIAAAREIDDGNEAYEYAPQEREGIRSCLIDMAFEEAEQLVALAS